MKPKLLFFGKNFLYFILALSFSSLHWVERKFGTPDLAQIIYHIAFTKSMALHADLELVLSFAKNVIAVSLAAAFILAHIDSYVTNKVSPYLKRANRITFFAWRWRVPAALSITSLFVMGDVSAFNYISMQNGSSQYFENNYTPPSEVKITGSGQKNLVLIYAESLEATYADKSIFGSNLIRELTTLDGISFESFHQVPGTGWTVAGLVSTQCAVPLKNAFFSTNAPDKEVNREMNKLGSRLSSFLPNATCLGDILRAHGYTNMFIGGASLEFAGKGAFLESHSYDELYGREELQEQGLEPDLNQWGYFDSAVLEFAKEKFKELHNTGKKFNLTLLTVDTHGPDGYLSKACAAAGANSFEGIIECTSAEIASFVRFIIDEGYLDNTNIVILSDHLAMRNPVSTKLDSASERVLFNKFIAKDLPVKNRDEVVHFDMLPTILNFIGFQVDGGKLGLGYSGFGEIAQLLAGDRKKQMEEEIPRKSELYTSLWY